MLKLASCKVSLEHNIVLPQSLTSCLDLLFTSPRDSLLGFLNPKMQRISQ